MSARTCRSCQYNVVSDVVTVCPNCGEGLPGALAPSSPATFVPLVLILVAGGAAWLVLREPGGGAPRPATPTSTLARATAPPARPAGGATPAPRFRSRDDAEADRLIALLDASQSAYAAADELSKSTSARAERALMSAYERREFTKMAGAAAFYARRRPPGYAKALVDLLHESKDLAVAQDLILSGDPQLVGPARTWASGVGFKLVRDPSTPTGVTWTSASTRAR